MVAVHHGHFQHHFLTIQLELQWMARWLDRSSLRLSSNAGYPTAQHDTCRRICSKYLLSAPPPGDYCVAAM